MARSPPLRVIRGTRRVRLVRLPSFDSSFGTTACSATIPRTKTNRPAGLGIRVNAHILARRPARSPLATRGGHVWPPILLPRNPVGGIVALARRKVWAFREAGIGTFLDAWKPWDVAGVIAVLAAEEYRRMPRRSGRRGSWVWSATSVPAVARQRLCG